MNMDSHTAQSDVVLSTRDQWLAFVQEVNELPIRCAPHRNEERNPLQLEVQLRFDDDGILVRRRLILNNVSNSGMMLKGDTELTPGTRLVAEVNPDGVPFYVAGVVMHCTQTVGGYKIGVNLQFV